jgi:hypothetical protein
MRLRGRFSVVQHSGLDPRQAENAPMTAIACNG